MTPFQPADIPGMDKWPEKIRDDAVFLNDVYQVNVKQMLTPKNGRILHLSIKRIDKQAIHDWRDLQWIKNQIAGPDVDAVEIYPAENRLVDTSNQYHLWCFLDVKFPFGFYDGRLISEKPFEFKPGQPSVQRPFADYCRPDDLEDQEIRLAAAAEQLKADMNKSE